MSEKGREAELWVSSTLKGVGEREGGGGGGVRERGGGWGERRVR